MADVDDGRFHSVGYTRWLTAAITMPVGVLFAFVGPWATAPGSSGWGAGNVAPRALITLTGLFFLFVGVRALVGGVRIRGGMVTVRNIFRTTSVAVDRADMFVIGPGLMGSGTCGALLLRDATEVRATLLGGAAETSGNHVLKAVVADLNSRLNQSRSSQSNPS